MQTPKHPSLYQVNTRVWLTHLSEQLGRAATLDDIPDSELDRFCQQGFDWLWFLSVWQTGSASQKISRSLPELRKEFEETLPDLRETDIEGSGFAITGYTVHAQLGGDAALSRLRERLRNRGLRLMLDFVPNHTALDHPWVEAHPEYFVSGNEADVLRCPPNYGWARRRQGDLVLAYGRDPYFPGWTDTFQLNYGNPATQAAMLEELLKIARQCDGVRCDMAMLVLPEVFARTWKIALEPFWPRATQGVRAQYPNFCFMAEVYWDLEWTLQQQGFNYTYDKKLYDRLREGNARRVREHFLADDYYQNHSARFLENHDEARAALAFSREAHKAAAVLAFICPGLHFFHDGQFEGGRKRISPHLVRAPEEPVDDDLKRFYSRLLAVLREPVVRDGHWQLLDCMPAWDGNWTSDCFIASAWHDSDKERLLVAVNYAPNQSQCYVRLPFTDLADDQWRFHNLLGEATYVRDGADLQARGLYLDEPAWRASVFSLSKT
jgi:Alpha amylase, catalytic domain